MTEMTLKILRDPIDDRDDIAVFSCRDPIDDSDNIENLKGSYR